MLDSVNLLTLHKALYWFCERGLRMEVNTGVVNCSRPSGSLQGRSVVQTP